MAFSIFLLSFALHIMNINAASKKFDEIKKSMASADSLDGLDSFYDPEIDYSVLTGRVSDRDQSSQILKIQSDHKNIKFFRAGDKMQFNITSQQDSDRCETHVRSVEENYFVVYVKDLNVCWNQDSYFRRGTQLTMHSKDLSDRIKESSLYRVVLLKRRKDFFHQLNKINHFIWSFDQQRVKVVSEYDKQIIALQLQKQKALDLLRSRKADKSKLQKELVYRLDVLDRDLDFYRIEKDEGKLDRWRKDHDLGLPVASRPQRLKKAKND
jgi:hypothetical protein